MNKSKEALIHAFNKGYRIKDGVPFYKDNQLKPKVSGGYHYFSVRHEKKVRLVAVHRLVALEKFGDAMFATGIEVRHLDSNSENNLHNNIGIGTKKENMADKDRAMVLKICAKAARKHDHLDIISMSKSGKSYTEIMQKYGIKSKGTISYIVNKSNESGVVRI